MVTEALGMQERAVDNLGGGEWQATDKYTITVHQKTEERDRRVGQLGAPLNQRTPPWLGEKGSPHRPRALAG